MYLNFTTQRVGKYSLRSLMFTFQKNTGYNFGRLCLVKVYVKLLLFPIKGSSPAKRSMDQHIHVCV